VTVSSRVFSGILARFKDALRLKPFRQERTHVNRGLQILVTLW
jgi:hypothetical protein